MNDGVVVSTMHREAPPPPTEVHARVGSERSELSQGSATALTNSAASAPLPTSAREPQSAASAPPPTTARISRPSSTSYDLLMQQFLDPNFPLEDDHLTNPRSTPVSRKGVLPTSAHILRECPRFRPSETRPLVMIPTNRSSTPTKVHLN